jgi:hypothetical protein
MSAGRHDLIIEQGATFTRTVQWFQADGVTPVNLAGYSARMMIRPSHPSATVLVSLTSTPAAGLVITDATGVVAITITDEQTAALEAGSAVYDLELESSGGQVTRLIEGDVTITPEVTR